MIDIIEYRDFLLIGCVIFSFLSLTLSGISVILGSYAAIKVGAIEKSTHSVTYMPIDPEVDKANKEYVEKWATGEEVIDQQNKQFAKDLEETMPDFFPNDDDKKKFVF